MSMRKPKKVATLSKKVLNVVTDFYLSSSDFNGIPIESLQDALNHDWLSFRGIIKGLVEEKLVGVIDEDTDINPYIIRRGFESIPNQIAKLEKDTSKLLCIYPRLKHLDRVVDRSKYNREPYKLSLALGEAQLSYRSFDLSVLEFYRNDPRYIYENDDIRGHIYYNSDDLQEGDKVLLKTFGFSYDDSFSRAVAVFLRYLCDLTPEHQSMWHTKEIRGNYKLHPAYYRNTIIGDWDDKVPIFSAFLKELFFINQMCEAMGRPHLFNEDFGEYGDRRPKKFGFLIRPTLQEFNDFILLFDKMISENINKSFFQNEVAYESEIMRKDGKILVVPKGTLKILDDWVRKFYRPTNWDFWEETMTSLEKVRKLRQKPAHAINEDQFDQKYFREQREMIIDVYQAIRNIRLLFANHPSVRQANIKIPDWLYEGKIWDI
jgi:hypothetical protein